MPNASRPPRLVAGPGHVLGDQASLLPEKYASMTRPVRTAPASCPSAFRRSELLVRRSCQTIALQTSAPGLAVPDDGGSRAGW